MQGHTSRPTGYIVRRLVDQGNSKVGLDKGEEHDMSFEGFGLGWEADEVARCLRGQLQHSPFRVRVADTVQME